MAQNSGKAENQHYVPQFLLRNFAIPNKKSKDEQIYVFDKHTDKVFPTNVKNIASERGFYDFYVGEEDRSLEPSLSTLEAQTQQALDKIIQNENLSVLSEEDRYWIALFVGTQFLRVKKQREMMKKFSREMAERIREMGFDPKEIEDAQEMDDEQVKMMTMRSFAKNSPVLAELVLKKIWILFKFPEENPLYISDHPVAMHNDQDFGPYGNIGFAVPMIQIYLPIGSNLALAFWCPAMEKRFRENVAEIEKIEKEMTMQLVMNPHLNREQAQGLLELCKREKQKPFGFIEKVNAGLPIMQTADQVMFMNSLQVHWAHRFVMCRDKDFALVERMIGDNEKYRTGISIGLG